MAGGSSGPGALPMEFAKRTRMNHETMIWYAIILSGLMGVFIVFHLSRLLAQKTGLATKLSGLAKPFVFVSRVLRRVFVRKVPGLPSAGHAVIAIAYLAVNIVLTVTHIDTSVLPYLSVIGARTGWLSIANIAFVVFLGLKNTPLSYLTAWSYERLNVLHQIAGYVTMALIIVHGATYASYFIEAGRIARLRVHEEIYGIASGFTFLVVVLAGAIVRLRYYELFYVLHVSFFAASMVLVGLHQPETSKRILIVTALGAALWFYDRLVRFVRVALYSVNNAATVHPLPHGGTRIVLKKAPFGARSGEHCFLWIPRVRALEMHPFTIAATGPLEFVVNSYDGFTRDLHEYAVRNPGATVWASVEGSYGTFPDPADYDSVLLVAGGSGASFTVGMALNLLKRVRQGSKQKVVFVWMVKDQARIDWFADHIATIRHALNAAIGLYVTRSPERQGSSSSSSASSSQDKVTTVAAAAESQTRSRSDTFSSSEEASRPPTSEKHEPKTSGDRQPKVLTVAISEDPEKMTSADVDAELASPVSPSTTVKRTDLVVDGSHVHGIPIIHGRPDVSAIIRKVVEEASSSDGSNNKRVLVMGCGPDALMAEVRNTTASCIRASGPGVELHCEQFGW